MLNRTRLYGLLGSLALGACTRHPAVRTGASLERTDPGVVLAPVLLTPREVMASLPLPEPATSFRSKALEPLLDSMRHNSPLRVVNRFHSSTVVLQLDLGNGLMVAFKPETHAQPGVWRHDVTAYQLSRMLGFSDRVPPAVIRTVPLSLLSQYVVPDGIIPIEPGSSLVRGVAIFWMPVLGTTEVHTPEGQELWARWLNARRLFSSVPLPMAGDISSLVVFDFLQANEDRWHYLNTAVDESGRVIFRDNNRGWMDGSMESLTSAREPFDKVERYSRTTISGLVHLDVEAFKQAVEAQGAKGVEIMSPSILRAFVARRAFVLHHIEQLIKKYGAATVLAFP